MLTGRISPVQERAIDLLSLLDAIDKAEEFGRQVRLTLAAANPKDNLIRLFPEWFEPEGEERVDATEMDLADTKGKWEFNEMSPHEAEKVLQQMLADPTGTVTLTQVDEERWI